METQEIKKMIEESIEDAQVVVTGDGRHFEALVVSNHFEGMSLLARQRQIYSALVKHIHDGNIHALSIKAKTPSELKEEKK